jgi:hypothetical protein
MSSKKKADLTGILDDLRNEDAKKRLAAVVEIKEVAAALGPAKVRGELIPFLACKSSLTQNSSTIKKILFWNSLTNSTALLLWWVG